ncbi:MAG TPA: type IX secretion system sortase PorU [Caldithrix abyssi]|uniref:Type IX secretion system sortase PorU n=1 Tax=Caldithrix abyssi TaxID=187145 RepID=A0A7V1LP27_CALAY|nr:type IX secretion system sortase PorU [Caldithrix abyssi]
MGIKHTEVLMKIFFMSIVLGLGLLAPATGRAADLTLLSSRDYTYTYRWQMTGLKVDTFRVEGQTYHNVDFENSAGQARPGTFYLPFRSMTFGVPEEGGLKVSIAVIRQRSLENIRLKAGPFVVESEEPAPAGERNIKPEWLETDAAYRFRDIYLQKLKINPLRYDENRRQLTVLEEAVITVKIVGNTSLRRSFHAKGKLDVLYKNMMVNFKDASGWQIPRPARRFAKTNMLTLKSYLTFDITENGVYKISASALRGIGSGDGMPVDRLRLYNNGGHQLSFATNQIRYNAPYSQEVPLFMVDADNDGLFNNADYFVFYGRGVNGWFYETGKADFEYQMHTYDTKNRYVLEVDGSGGKRMTNENVPDLSNPQTVDYGTFRFHYEKDQYNLLSSGPDWYGYRFFGTSNNFTFNFELPPRTLAGKDPTVKVRLKGATAIRYQEPSSTYYFNMSINNAAVINNLRFSGAARVDATRKLPLASLNNGVNSVSFQYQGSKEAAVAHLDDISIIYQARLTALDNMLDFFSTRENNNRSYKVSGLGGGNDWQIWNISDAANPRIYARDVSPQAGSLTINVAANQAPKEWLVFSLSQTALREVTEFGSYTPEDDLLSTSNQADYVIVTRRELREKGEEFARLRPHLTSKVVSVEDIEFFFNSGVQDPTAIRNFFRYAYFNWQSPSISYVLLLGDGHYDYRNISISQQSVVPVFEIYNTNELDSREVDLYFTDLVSNDNSESKRNIRPDIAIARIPIENARDADVMLDKIKTYEANPIKEGWQVQVTLVADDTTISAGKTEPWLHQPQTEKLIRETAIKNFNIKKIYLTAYKPVAGGRGILKPGAQQDIIDQINNGTLLLNYVGHGSPTTWAHETVFNFDRDYASVNNPGRYTFLVAATCDFGMFDNPNLVSFTEGLIWKKEAGIIGALVATRLVYSQQNAKFNRFFYKKLFPDGKPSIELGAAFLQALHEESGSNVNDQKYHILGDPTMTLIDPRESIEVTSVQPDTLKALSTVEVRARVTKDGQPQADFNGGAILIVNDAMYENVNTGGGSSLNYNLQGPLLFKGEVSVENGELDGKFIVPKSIRYKNRPTGRVSVYAWDDEANRTAFSSRNDLLFLGSENRTSGAGGPDIDIYFKNQENFSSGDLIQDNPILVVELEDENGVNITGQVGHRLELSLDGGETRDVSEFFKYNRNSFTRGRLEFPLGSLKPGQHTLSFRAFDNLNNASEQIVEFAVTGNEELSLEKVLNYPNPFEKTTRFTFQTNRENAEVTIKIYTMQGRVIQKLEGFATNLGFNVIEWDGRDYDGDEPANGVYLYKITIKDGDKSRSRIEKMVKVR